MSHATHPAPAVAMPDPAPTIPAAMSYSAVLAALRAKSSCADCGKTRAVLNVAGHGRPFRAEKIDPRTHCSCLGGPAYVAPTPEPIVAEVCERCGEERQRAEFYDEPCRGEAQADGYLAPVQGTHSWVRVELDAPAMGVER